MYSTWDYLFDIQLNNPSRIKGLPVSLFFFTPRRPYAPSKSQIFTAGDRYVLREAQIATSYIAAKSSRAQLALQGLIVHFAPIWGVEHHSHT